MSTRNIRRGNIALFLLYPLAACAFDLMYAGRDFQWLGVDSVALQLLAYSLPLTLAFFIQKPSLRLTRVCAMVALVAIPFMYFSPPSFEIIPCLLFHAAIGFCSMVSIYVMMFRLNNAERLIGLLLHSLQYALSMMLRPILQSVVSYALDYSIVYMGAGLFTLALVLVLFTIGEDDLPDKGLGGVAEEGMPSAKPPASSYTVFILVALYDFFTGVLSGFTYNTLMTNLAACGFGVLFGVVVIWAIHALFVNSSWHVWSLFLAATTLGVLCTFGRTFALHSVAQGLLSAGETFGLTAAMYMAFGIGKKVRHIAYFRGYCGLSLLLAILPILVFRLDLDALSQNHLLLSLAAMAICLLITVFVAPLLQRRLFTMEWTGELRQIDIGAVLETAQQTGLPEYPDLTPREREVCSLLLCGKTMRQIAGELSISPSTVSFHCRALYRKMGISSRIELFARFSDRLPISS